MIKSFRPSKSRSNKKINQSTLSLLTRYDNVTQVLVMIKTFHAQRDPGVQAVSFNAFGAISTVLLQLHISTSWFHHENKSV